MTFKDAVTHHRCTNRPAASALPSFAHLSNDVLLFLFASLPSLALSTRAMHVMDSETVSY